MAKAISSEALSWERSTTRAKARRAKWPEMGSLSEDSEDIV
jgi:hypothetical protein